ncbi:MAG TPA: peptidoglycan-associated lipoprotein Pal [bacterium]|nr:peptidoglycan-associated lipoprotein Pal [bacterium]
MEIARITWARSAMAAAAMLLLAGCGGNQPEPVMEPEPAPAPPPVEEPTPPPREEKPAWVDPNQQYASTLVNIHFDFNKYNIRSEDKPKLEAIGALLKNNADFKLLIEGHCDERGTNEYNMSLGEQRALSTKRYLVSLGVSEGRFTTISYGEERPLDMGQNEAAWAKNRRCQFRVEAPRP